MFPKAHKPSHRGIIQKKVFLNSAGGLNKKRIFEDCKGAIVQNATYSHLVTAQSSFIYFDASDRCWSGIDTYVSIDDPPPFHARKVIPARLRSQPSHYMHLRQNILEEEEFAVVVTLAHLH